MKKSILAVILLPIILIFAGYLRFVGQNWDDFTYLHPDERFLTLNLLPQVGGLNEFTPDDHNFPPQKIVVHPDSGITSRLDLINNPGFKIGATRATMSADIARWLLGADQVVEYDTNGFALDALNSGQIQAIMIPSAETSFGTASSVDSFTSQEIQALRCEFFYPDSNGIGGYFDTFCSPLNPHQAGQGFYTYGTLPLFMAHFASEIVEGQSVAGNSLFNWQGGHLVWRGLSAIFDMLAVVLVFMIGRRLHNVWVGLLAAVLYATFPLAIEKAHFGTVNAITAFFVTLAIYFAVIVQQHGRYYAYVLFGVACGAAVASRINVAPLAGVIVLAAMIQAAPILDNRLTLRERQRVFAYHFVGLILAGLATFIAFRVFNPYAFEGPGIFGLKPNWRFFDNIQSGNYGVSGNQDSPPNWQWLARAAYLYPLKDMLFWTMGLASAVLAWFSWGWAGYRIIRFRKTALINILLFVWVAVYFGWMGRIWVLTPRYFLPIYSALALLAGWGIYELYSHALRRGKDLPITRLLLAGFGVFFGIIGIFQIANGMADTTAWTCIALAVGLLMVAVLPIFQQQKAIFLGGFVVVFSVIWGLMYANIYHHQLTRVQGARWIFEKVPGDFAMRIEGADPDTPLINIAIPNNGYYSDTLTGGVFERATQYYETIPSEVGFVAPADGTITSVFAPHLGDPLDDPEAEKIYITIVTPDISLPIAEAVLDTDLARDAHPLGNSYEIPFNIPLQVKAGQQYTFQVRTMEGSGDVIGSGSVVIAEGAWDDRLSTTKVCTLPDGLTLADDIPSGMMGFNECQGTEAWLSLINSYDQSMSYPVDNKIKYDDIIYSLEVGDYLTISSNRFYDTMPRHRTRWPLTSIYYDELFAGNLGFELVEQIDETFELGPLRVSDEYLPTYSSPAWLNELEADEAFHVYDHPAVFIFKKQDDFSIEKVEAIFSKVSFIQAQDITNTIESDEKLGIIYWSSIDADQVPSALMLPKDAWETQTKGGTWSERFFSESIINTSQPVGVLVWYLAIFGFGLLAFPLLFGLLPRMADRGYGVAKLVGLLLVAWLAWTLSSLKVPMWSQGGIILSIVIIAFLSAVVGYRNRVELRQYIRANWKRLAWMELISLLAFLAFLMVRLSNPDLWHYAKGGEKPMDFAYFNGVLRSTIFPAIDPWFSGGYINYYYFGFVLVGSPVLLLGVVPSFAYNLVIPTLFSLTGMSAFSGAYNIVALWREGVGDKRDDDAPKRRLGNPWIAGIAALFMCVVLGNLDTIRVIGNGVAQLGGYQMPLGLDQFLIKEWKSNNIGQDPSFEIQQELTQRAASNNIIDRLRYEIDNSVSLVGGLIQGSVSALSGNSLPIGQDRWYWGPSRVLAETKGVEGNAITEMPYFTFLYGDLHAHMFNMPMILLAVLFLFNEVSQAIQDGRGWLERFLALALGAMTIGLMQATNTWDWPSMMLFAIIGLTYVWWMRWNDTFQALDGAWVWFIVVGILAIVFGILSVAVGQIAADPSVSVLVNIVSAIRLVILMLIALIIGWVAVTYFLVRASAVDLALYVGGFLFLSWLFVLPYSSWYAATYNSIRLWDGGKTPLWAYLDIHGLFIFLILSLLIWETGRWLRDVRVSELRGMHRNVNIAVAVALGGLLLTFVVSAMGYQVALIAIPLIVWIAILFFRPEQSSAMRFTLVIIGLALAMTFGVEVIVIGGDIERQNTVFKFYIQAWLLFSVAGGVALAWLWQVSDYWSNFLRFVWYTPLMILIMIAGLYPFMATRARAYDRMAPDMPLTLNGMDYMQYSSHYETDNLTNTGEVIDLNVDYQLIRWLQENVQGSPVIMEGRSYPSEYHWNSRIAINTGLPSVLGWNFHQRQQRTFDPLPRVVDQRGANVRTFYKTADVETAVSILNYYDVEYIIVSGLEVFQATSAGIDKFDTMVGVGLLEVAFEIDGGTIYHVNRDAMMSYLVE